ncbi:MAG: slipin family protein, partial [Cyanobacteriota bacterium]|nr:slipin family protein [Cyanobacteriota bacterium]
MNPISIAIITIAILIFSGFKIDREYQRGVIFRLGRFSGIKGPGMYWIVPLIDQKAQV